MSATNPAPKRPRLSGWTFTLDTSGSLETLRQERMTATPRAVSGQQRSQQRATLLAALAKVSKRS